MRRVGGPAGELLRRLAEHDPDAPALGDGTGPALGYGTVLAAVDALAGELTEHGVRGLALAMDNGPGQVIADLAASAAGAWSLPLPPFFTDGQRANSLGRSGCRYLLTDRSVAGAPPTASFDVAGTAVHLYPTGVAGPDATRPGTVKVTFTSGSTGDPKGACLSAAHLLGPVRSVAAAVAPLALTRHVALLPFAVLLENVAGIHAALHAGIECTGARARRMTSILVVEDDPLIGQALERWLEREHRVSRATTLAAARDAVAARDFDVVLLDVGLPDGRGLELLRTLSRHRRTAATLVLTAYGDVDSRIRGLDLGTDDYLVKPVDFHELDARIRAVRRRRDGLASTVIEHGALRFDLNGMGATLDGEPVHLSARETAILAVLLQGRGRHFSRAQLEQRTRPDGDGLEGNAIEVHVSALRRKLGRSLIRTVRGLGYIVEKAPGDG